MGYADQYCHDVFSRYVYGVDLKKDSSAEFVLTEFNWICTWAICVGRDRRFYFEYFIGSKKDRSYYYFNESGIVIRS